MFVPREDQIGSKVLSSFCERVREMLNVKIIILSGTNHPPCLQNYVWEISSVFALDKPAVAFLHMDKLPKLLRLWPEYSE